MASSQQAADFYNGTIAESIVPYMAGIMVLYPNTYESIPEYQHHEAQLKDSLDMSSAYEFRVQRLSILLYAIDSELEKLGVYYL